MFKRVKNHCFWGVGTGCGTEDCCSSLKAFYYLTFKSTYKHYFDKSTNQVKCLLIIIFSHDFT